MKNGINGFIADRSPSPFRDFCLCCWCHLYRFFSNKALDGYDTVAYFTEGKPVEGNKDFKISYKGADWYFSSQENLDKFQADPDKFAPQYGGYCAWAIAAKNDFAPGDPKQWSIVDDKLYLNYDKSVKNQWLQDVPGFIAQGDKNWPTLLAQ